MSQSLYRNNYADDCVPVAAGSSSYASSSNNGYSSPQFSASSAIDANILQHENPNRCTDLAPALPLDQYRLNVDNNPHVIRKKPQEKVQYLQEVSVRYLKPPQAPRAGDIVIKQLPSRQVAPAPALVVRQPGPIAPTPPPCVIRECPPQPPQPLPGKIITVPGKIIPPPARKVVVEKLPPVPPKPQQVLIERWLPYGPQTQRVVYQPVKAPCIIPDPKNVVIQWEAPDVEVRRECKNLGVVPQDPREYLSRHGSSLIRSDQLPELAVKYSSSSGIQLAANHRGQEAPLLEGDVNALTLVDLDQNGLGYLRSRINAAGGASSHAFSSDHSAYSHGGAGADSSYSAYSSSSAAYAGSSSQPAAYHSSDALFGSSSAAIQSYESSSFAHTGDRFC